MLLTEKRPLKTPLAFGGRSFIIDMSYNNILTTLEILDDDELNAFEKGCLALFVLTDDDMFEDVSFLGDTSNFEYAQELLHYIFDTLISNDDTEEAVPTDLLGNPLPQPKGSKNDKSFDFQHDADYIYASFMQAYRMDLFEKHDKLHWSEFIALFNGLPSETIMMKIIDIRQRELPKGKNSEKEREELKKAKKKFALPEKKGGEG